MLKPNDCVNCCSMGREPFDYNEYGAYYDPIYELPYRIGGRYETIGAGKTLMKAIKDAKS